MHRFKRPAAALTALLLVGLIGCAGCASRVEWPVVSRCEGEAVSAIRNRTPAEADAMACVLYFIRDGALCWRGLHDDVAGVLLDGAAEPVLAVAAAEEEIFYLYQRNTRAGGVAIGRIDGRGWVERDWCTDLPEGCVRLCWTAGELFCADGAGLCYRVTAPDEVEAVPVGPIWALTADAVIFAEGSELRGCLRSDYSTITSLAEMPGGSEIVAIAVDQATEEETRIYVLDAEGQVASFADGSWSLHGTPIPGADPASLAVAAGGCLLTDPDGVWYIDAAEGGIARVCPPTAFVVAEERIYAAPYDGEAIPLAPQ